MLFRSVTFAYTFLMARWAPSSGEVYTSPNEVADALFGQFVFPFELASVLLLVAIIAAITLTMRRRKGLKVQDVAAQVATRREDRVRLLQMKAEKPE